VKKDSLNGQECVRLRSITKNDFDEPCSCVKNTRHGGIGELKRTPVASPASGDCLSVFPDDPIIFCPLLQDEAADAASEATDALRVPETPDGSEVMERLRDTCRRKFLPVEPPRLIGKLNDDMAPLGDENREV
jgi:hypothetical protein